MPKSENQLIARLPRSERQRLLAACELVQLQMGESLWEAGDLITQVYFPLKACVSLLTHVDAHPSLEVGLVGAEGMVGAQLLLGVREASIQALVQTPGPALRLSTHALQRELAESRFLPRLLQRYLYAWLAQQTNAAGCLRFHLIGPRLARWLLMSHDRAQGDSFQMTHEFLASMLGVRRVGITAAAGVLQQAGLIRYRRGELQILDRTGLEAAACSCYARDRRSLSRLLD